MHLSMTRVFRLLAGAATAALLFAASSASADSETVTVTVDGKVHRSLLYKPESAASGAPLVLILHGGGGRPERMRRVGFETLADTHGFLAAYPEGTNRSWADGRDTDFTRQRKGGTDDVAFLRALIGKLIAEYDADPDRVYITGASNGGMMSFRMACDAADLIAAAAPIIANLPVDYAGKCKPSRPVPMLIMNGTEDEFVPYEGGQIVPFLKDDRGSVLSTTDTVRFWTTANECRDRPEVEQLADTDTEDGTRVIKSRWSECAGDAEVLLYRIEGGGHTVPGTTRRRGRLRPMAQRLGKTSQDINGAAEIWTFFSRHSR